MTSRITCGGCDNTWTGLTYAHCGACHITFAGVGLFDRHREREEGGDAHCVAPPMIVDKNDDPMMFLRADGIWHGPEATEEQKAKLKALRPEKVEIVHPDEPLQLIELASTTWEPTQEALDVFAADLDAAMKGGASFIIQRTDILSVEEKPEVDTSE